MHWFRTHPYVSALGAAGVLVLLGAFIVVSRASQPAGTRTSAWGGEAAQFLNPTSHGPSDISTQTKNSMGQVQDGPPYTYIAPNFSNPASADGEEESPYDFDAFIAKLTKGANPKGQATAQEEDSLLSAYAYIPRGLISTSTSDTTRSTLQQELYEYGNDIGSTIESFEQQHSNTPQILKGQVEDRTDPEKAAAVVRIGRDLEEMGDILAAMETVPSSIASAHNALSKSYIEIGKNLALIPKAANDTDFIKAIQTYNASADTFAKNYIQIVSLFGAHGVAFSANDAGKVFTFTPTGF